MDPSRASSSSAPTPATSSGDRFGRVIKKFKLKLGSPSPEDSSSTARTHNVRPDANRTLPTSPGARPLSPRTPNIDTLYVASNPGVAAAVSRRRLTRPTKRTFGEPIIADEDGDDDALLYEDDYNTLLRDAQYRARPRPLFDRYGLDFERSGLTVSPRNPSEVPRARVLRAEKSVRVRVRYNCCRCEKTFGSAPICSGCEHERCKQCPRYPPRRRNRPTASTEELREAHPPPIPLPLPSAASNVDKHSFKSAMYLNMPSKANYQAMQPPPVMINRLRRICHVCDQHFVPSSAPICDSCGHEACRACLRDSTAFLKRRRSSSSGSEADDDTSTEITARPLAIQQDVGAIVPRLPAIPIAPKEGFTCDRCEANFVYGLKVCGDCLHNKCSSCETRIRRLPSETLSDDSSSPFAGEMGGSMGLIAA